MLILLRGGLGLMYPPLHGQKHRAAIPVQHELAQDAQVCEDLEAGAPLQGDRALIH